MTQPLNVSSDILVSQAFACKFSLYRYAAAGDGVREEEGGGAEGEEAGELDVDSEEQPHRRRRGSRRRTFE